MPLYYGPFKGRTATYVVAASDAPAHVKAQADFVCDGVDDDEQIQAAIDALSTGGGKVQLSEGRFIISSPILIANRHSVTISGMGRSKTSDTDTVANYGGTTISLANGANCHMFLITHATETCFNLLFENFTLHGNKANNPTGGDGFNTNTFFGFWKNVSVEWIKGSGWHYTSPNAVKRSAGNLCQDCYVRETEGHGWELDSYNYDHYWFQCYVSGVRGAHDAWHILGGAGFRLIGCEMDNCEQHGVYLDSTSLNRVINCMFSAAITGYSLFLFNASRNIVANNTFNPHDTPTSWCLVFGKYGGTNANNLIVDNMFVGGAYGIALAGITATTIAANLIADNQFTGQATAPIHPNVQAESGFRIRDNIGYATENSGTATGTDAQQLVAHGLAFTPTRQQIALIAGSATANPFHSADPDATNIKVTAAAAQAWYWATAGG